MDASILSAAESDPRRVSSSSAGGKRRAITSKIAVGVRIRPHNEKELADIKNQGKFNNWEVEEDSIWETHDGGVEEIDAVVGTSARYEQLKRAERSKKRFKFTNVFTEKSGNHAVHEAMSSELVEWVLEGFNTTLLTYGQTSSG